MYYRHLIFERDSLYFGGGGGTIRCGLICCSRTKTSIVVINRYYCRLDVFPFLLLLMLLPRELILHASRISHGCEQFMKSFVYHQKRHLGLAKKLGKWWGIVMSQPCKCIMTALIILNLCGNVFCNFIQRPLFPFLRRLDQLMPLQATTLLAQ